MRKGKSIFGKWVRVLLFRRRIEQVVAEGASFGESVKQLAIAAGIFGALMGAAILALVLHSPRVGGLIPPALLTLSAVLIPVMVVLGVFLAVLSVAVNGLIYHLISKIFSGKATLEQYLSMLSQVNAPILGAGLSPVALILIFFALLGQPFAGLAIAIALSVVLSLESLVLMVLGTAAVQQFSRLKAAVVVLLPTIILVVILLLQFAIAMYGPVSRLA